MTNFTIRDEDNIDIVLILPRILPDAPVILFDGITHHQISYTFLRSDGSTHGNKITVQPLIHSEILVRVLPDAEELTFTQLDASLTTPFTVTLISRP